MSKIRAPAGSGRGPRSGHVLALLIAALALAARLAPSPTTTPPVALDPAPLYALAATLAADELGGRGAGTDGLARAADLLAARLAACGIAPAGKDGGFFQPFEATAPARLGAANRLLVREAGAWRELRLHDDWIPHGASASGTAAGPLTYASLDAPREPASGEPASLAGRIVLVPLPEPGPHGGSLALRLLATAARERGARGVVAIRAGDAQRPPDRRVPGAGWNVADAGIPIVVVPRAALGGLVAGLPESPPAVPLDLPDVELELSVGLVRQAIAMRNVVGRVPGTGGGGTVVLGAHYDHLGSGSEGSLADDGEPRIHPGADDNASGVAVAVAVACALAAHPAPRSLIVALFAGEEIGLLGSAAYVNDPAVPIDETVAMVNLDMVGRLRRDRLVAFGTGTAVELGPLVRDVAETTGLRIIRQDDGFGPSDHTSFFAAGRPVLHFFTGVHEDYHRPSDRPETLNARGMAEVARAVFETVWRLASGPEPTFVAAAAPRPAPGGGGYGAYLGIIPDFTSTPRGVRLAGVRPDSPAARAGLARGHQIVALGGVTIGDLYDLTFALRARQPGDRVVIEYLQAGRRRRTDVTLGQR